MANSANDQEARLAQMRILVEELAGSSRRRRQEVAHKIATVAHTDASMVTPFVGSLMDALERPEAQTRWEVLDALTALVDEHAEEVAPAFEAAETALFDEDSAPVRLAGFVFLCRFGVTSEERSDQVWPLLDEAIQCYHGDPEYRDMLVALLAFVQGAASAATKAALAERLKFDAENGASYVKSFSVQIIQACK
ncbi:MAG: hypothetical protein PUF86_03930 [Paratractidigestivibacter faecalis]|uniref:hypothetical protein n=1 Tax=Paratractidigestivibacter faecalis TaxID=2292441 RepID=UPI0026E9468E|nr:hypothetical protein [Paratractidigestivibacter faecalis]MDD6417816.1 hypothetical protein [Paratractidigestivibacter faecalis]